MTKLLDCYLLIMHTGRRKMFDSPFWCAGGSIYLPFLIVEKGNAWEYKWLEMAPKARDTDRFSIAVLLSVSCWTKSVCHFQDNLHHVIMHFNILLSIQVSSKLHGWFLLWLVCACNSCSFFQVMHCFLGKNYMMATDFANTNYNNNHSKCVPQRPEETNKPSKRNKKERSLSGAETENVKRLNWLCAS